MRYFISIDVNDESVKNNLVNFMDELSGIGDIDTVPPQNLHITLLFLGERGGAAREELRASFIDACEDLDVGEFTCMLSGVGVFPHMNYIEVVWASAEPEKELDELHMNFDERMSGGNEHDFVPHVTVGRVRGVDPGEKQQLQELIESHPADFGAFDVDRVRLKESVSGEGGPTYRDVEVHEL
ncbi:MAG: RNA 2',3'-cyclic phosphodiesterase [Candidatus Nanohaloarchaea archaeon]|nr:RNA 2',3'-cyclic phosphodiesterase [Candidatus Nanohaloarchaea archaeon]